MRAEWAPLFALALLPLSGCVNEPPEPSGYSGLHVSPIRGLTAEQIRGLEAGEGMGYALPAELNGYPGPKHVLELAEELDLTESQWKATERVRAAMLDDAQDVGAALLGVYRELDEAFRSKSVTPEAVEQSTRQIGEFEGQLRAIHMAGHLEMMTILTHEQLLRYVELRGYGAPAHTADAH